MRDGAPSRSWPLLVASAVREERLERRAERRGPVAAGLYEFARFGAKQA